MQMQEPVCLLSKPTDPIVGRLLPFLRCSNLGKSNCYQLELQRDLLRFSRYCLNYTKNLRVAQKPHFWIR